MNHRLSPFVIFLVVLFGLSFISKGFSQTLFPAYQPLSSDPSLKRAERTRIKVSAPLELTTSTKPYQKDIRDIFEDRNNYLDKLVEKDVFLIGTWLNDYVNTVWQRIVRANPGRNLERVSVLIHRSAVPNAVCYGEGTLAINLGLLRRLENESQLAFVLAHEAAHYSEDHVDVQILERVEVIHSPDFKKKMRQLKRKQYGKLEMLRDISKNLIYSESRHSRDREKEADSLGFIFLNNTAYDPSQAIKCLALMDEIDQPKLDRDLDLAELLRFEELGIEEDWKRQKSSLSSLAGPASFLLPDSLKTHPDCQSRIGFLLPYLNVDSEPQTFIQGEELFQKMVVSADMEAARSPFLMGDFGRALYTSIELKRLYPKNTYPQSLTLIALCQILQARKAHELSNRMALPNQREQSAAYRECLEFAQNVRSSGLEKIIGDQRGILAELGAQDLTSRFALSVADFVLGKGKSATAKSLITNDGERIWTDWLSNHPYFSEK